MFIKGVPKKVSVSESKIYRHLEAFIIIKQSAIQLLMLKTDNTNQKYTKFTNGHFLGPSSVPLLQNVCLQHKILDEFGPLPVLKTKSSVSLPLKNHFSLEGWTLQQECSCCKRNISLTRGTFLLQSPTFQTAFEKYKI